MKTLAALVAVAGVGLAAATTASARPIEGDWFTKDGNARVRLSPCGQALCGVIVGLKHPIDAATGRPLADDHNPDAGQRGRPRLGLEIVRGMKSAGPEHWSGGQIYDPNSGKTYDAKMTLNADATLKVEGCVAIICLAQTWTRAD